MNAVTRMEAWDQLVADPRPQDHIVQLYQEKAFLNRAVCRFVGAGLANGEGIILVSTAPHWTGFHAHLENEGVNVGAARKRGQLTVVDADEPANGAVEKRLLLVELHDVIARARVCHQLIPGFGLRHGLHLGTSSTKSSRSLVAAGAWSAPCSCARLT